MNFSENAVKLHWLFTDLDGTLIPLDGNQRNVQDLQTLKRVLNERNIGLVFVTGRHFQSACQALKEYSLPAPQWIICDVGTTIVDASEMEKSPNRDYANLDYVDELAAKTSGWDSQRLQLELRLPSDLRLQESKKQGDFKISFYADATRLSDLTKRCQQQLDISKAPYGIVSSVDPFTGDGLIDFLPTGVDKAFAARWLARRLGLDYEGKVIYAGDSGNDLAALTSGCRSILVGNADQAIAKQIQSLPISQQVFFSDEEATSGVLQGIRRFCDPD